ncbi:hypothetical protein LCGC14_2600950, partial [marine sediment metagenome]
DMDGTIRMANNTSVEMLGYARHDLVGRSVLDLYADTPAGKDKARRLNQRIEAGEEIRDEELEMRRADGRTIWVSLTVQLIRNRQGQLLGRRGVVVDFTARKRAEETLTRTNRALRMVSECNQALIREQDE